ncbi:MAG: Structural toxin protein [uncultured bacterium]|nr:MAG: Structural toxin protein [uncultured bacterium]
MYKISVLIPSSHLETVKHAMFDAGAGRIGNYKNCAWQVLGQGEFLPLENAQPFMGEKNQSTTVSEYYVQMICSLDVIHAVITALKTAHPYEEPAYDIIKLETF